MIKNLVKKAKKQFFTGIIVILPIGMTAWIVWILFKLIGKRFLPLFKSSPFISALPLSAQMTISALLTIVVIWFVGVWARNYIGKISLKWFETLLLKMPIISKIYKTIRKITDIMFVNKQAFKKAALIEYPRKGSYSVVFVANDNIVVDGKEFMSLFIPSTPNPTTGYCVVLPKEDVFILDISINQAMEFVFSGGILIPPGLKFPKEKR